MINPIFLTDGYKPSHIRVYPPAMTSLESYFSSRGGSFDHQVFVGLQYILHANMSTRITMRHVREADELFMVYFGRKGVFHQEAFEHIVNAHGGCWPVRIKAVPEGTVLPPNNVLFKVRETCSQCAWVVNYLETILVQTWYPMTVATVSRRAKEIILHYLKLTGGDPESIWYRLHDFGFRGSTSAESAGIGGFAHLVNFRGSDTLPAMVVARDYYRAGLDSANSIPATEHSTITAWGIDGEAAAYRRLMEMYPSGTIACVSDSYDITKACTVIWGEQLRNEVLARNGCLVVRPDSGHPPTTVLDVVSRLGAAFGFSLNQAGYRVLNPKVRVIQGDGLDLQAIESILSRMALAGWAAENVTFGMGGALLQKVNRDTLRMAYKASNVVVNGMERPIFKRPVHDMSKESRPGKLKLVHEDGVYKTVLESAPGDDCLRVVYEDGFIRNDNSSSLSEIRSRAAVRL